MKMRTAGAFALATLLWGCGGTEEPPPVDQGQEAVRKARASLGRYQDLKIALDEGFKEVVTDPGFIEGRGVLFDHETRVADHALSDADIEQPQALLYDIGDDPDGSWILVAVVYRSTAGGTILGQSVGEELTVWLFKDNAGGLFSATNARVDVPAWWSTYTTHRKWAWENVRTPQAGVEKGYGILVGLLDPFFNSAPELEQNRYICLENQPFGSMGLHHMNGAKLVRPEAMDGLSSQVYVYEPIHAANSTVTVGFEVVASEFLFLTEAGMNPVGQTHPVVPPGDIGLWGHPFNGPIILPRLPERWTRHAWYKTNPNGIFMMWNPTVKCDKIPMSGRLVGTTKLSQVPFARVIPAPPM